jgi:hypothetical protein
MKYLGLSLGACFKARFIWDGIIEKIELRLSLICLPPFSFSHPC